MQFRVAQVKARAPATRGCSGLDVSATLEFFVSGQPLVLDRR